MSMVSTMGRVEPRAKSARLPVVDIAFGRLVSPTRFVSVERLATSCTEVFLNFCVRDVAILLPNNVCIEFTTRELEDIVLDETAQKSVFVTLKHPPRIYKHKDHREDLEFAMRQKEVELAEGRTISRGTFATCRTLRWTFAEDRSSVLDTFLGFLLAVGKEISAREVTVGNATTVGHVYDIPQQIRHREVWTVQWAWLCLVSSQGFVRERFTDGFFERLNDCTESLAVDVLQSLTRQMNDDLFVDPVQAFEDALKRGFPRTDVQDAAKHCRVPRLVLTPTRRIFYEADIMQSNRVLREWSKKAQFLRVTIRDDNFSKLSSSKGNQEHVLKCIYDELRGGLVIGSKTFHFLGCSNNQVRDHGCFFVDATEEKEIAVAIRSWAGNLESIHNVAKYISRLGQIFSTSTSTVEINPSDCVRIQDITVKDYCFTDGIGKISQDLAEKVSELDKVEM